MIEFYSVIKSTDIKKAGLHPSLFIRFSRQESAGLWESSALMGLNDFFHVRHVTAQGRTDGLNRMVANRFIDFD